MQKRQSVTRHQRIQRRNFVTVQFLNNQSRKRYSKHKQSVLKQMIFTQSILDNNLLQSIQKKSTFSKKVKTSFIQKIVNQGNLKKPLHEGLRKKQQESFKMHPDTRKKFRQIQNISFYFEKACSGRKNKNLIEELTNKNNNIPLTIQQDELSPREDTESLSLLTYIQQKIKQSKNYLNKSCKDSLSSSKCQFNQYAQKCALIAKSLKCIQIQQQKIQRKTTPRNTKIIKQLLTQRNKKYIFNQNHNKQSALKLQEFVRGGEPISFNQFSNYLNINQFNKSRQNFITLNDFYDSVRQNISLDLKAIPKEDEPPIKLQTAVYYIQNSHNMGEFEKRVMRKKFNIID